MSDLPSPAPLPGSRAKRLTICYAGTYERNYPRNRDMIRTFRAAGARVEEVHVPVFGQGRDKSSLGKLGMALTFLKLVFAYLRLIPDVALRMLRCDVLATGYIGQLDTIVLAPLAKLSGKPVVMNPLVTLTDTIVEDRQLVPEGGIAAKIVHWIDARALRSAKLIITDTCENATYIRDRFGIPDRNLAVIPVGADESIYFPSDDGPVEHDFLDVLFYGKFIPLHGTDTIIRAAAIAAGRDPAVRFELIGRGQEYERTRRLANELSLENVSWIEWLSEAHLAGRLRRADVALGVFGGGYKAGRVIPNKVHQALACGVATITRCAPPIERHFQAGQDIITVPPENPEALAAAILELRDVKLRGKIAASGRQTWSEFASQPAIIDETRRVLQRLTRPHRRSEEIPGG